MYGLRLKLQDYDNPAGVGIKLLMNSMYGELSLSQLKHILSQKIVEVILRNICHLITTMLIVC